MPRPIALNALDRNDPHSTILLAVVIFALLSISATAQQPAEPRPSESSIPALQDAPLSQYRAYRRMHAWSEKHKHEAWLECWTEFDASGFRYEIVSETGSDYVREKVLRNVLKREQELFARGQGERADLSAANYEFVDADTHGDGLRYVLLKPRRKDVLLVDGRMVLSEDGTQLLRVEGRLAKNPSFWTNLVNIVRRFARVDGVRVPISTESIAKLKFAGTSRMEVEYEYETINGRPVSLTARRMIASAHHRNEP